MPERNLTSIVQSVNCMKCGGKAYLDTIDRVWRHQREDDWKSPAAGGAHKVLLPEVSK